MHAKTPDIRFSNVYAGYFGYRVFSAEFMIKIHNPRSSDMQRICAMSLSKILECNTEFSVLDALQRLIRHFNPHGFQSIPHKHLSDAVQNLLLHLSTDIALHHGNPQFYRIRGALNRPAVIASGNILGAQAEQDARKARLCTAAFTFLYILHLFGGNLRIAYSAVKNIRHPRTGNGNILKAIVFRLICIFSFS